MKPTVRQCVELLALSILITGGILMLVELTAVLVWKLR